MHSNRISRMSTHPFRYVYGKLSWTSSLARPEAWAFNASGCLQCHVDFQDLKGFHPQTFVEEGGYMRFTWDVY